MLNKFSLLLCVWLISTSQIAGAQTAPIAPAERPVRQKWALVVGISKFANGIQSLKYAAKDAKDFGDYLVKEAAFPADHVKFLLDEQASKEEIFKQIGDEWLPRVANPDDLVVIYFSTAGSPSSSDAEGVNYLTAYDTNPKSLFASGIAMQEFQSMVSTRIHSNRVVFILDASYSGGAIPKHDESDGHLGRSHTGTSEFALICSCASGQTSWESTKNSNSVFTMQWIEAMHKLGPQATLSEVFDQTKSKVQSEVAVDRKADQTPVAAMSAAAGKFRLAAPATEPPKSVPKI